MRRRKNIDTEAGEGWYIVPTIHGPRIHIKREAPEDYILGPYETYLQADSAFEGWQKRIKNKEEAQNYIGCGWVLLAVSALIWGAIGWFHGL